MSEKSEFTSPIGLILTLLGCVVGTGNIWRFPRILALTSDGSGSLSFILVWVSFLFLWSMPMILAEYAMGRYAKGGPIVAFRNYMGPRGGVFGIWISGVTTAIAAYYVVIQGWCFYYVYYSITASELPIDSKDALDVFTAFSSSPWSVLTQAIGLLLGAAFTIGGIHWIEKANKVAIPVLLLILLFTFAWAMSMSYSDYGIQTMFNPNWGKLADPNLWINAASQNAFDTSAGMGQFLTYASYMSSRTGIVRLSVFIPLGNNLVSLLCGITIYSTAFSILVQDPTMTRAGIMEIMKTQGPGGTGLTFVWMPVLFGTAGVLGRIICVLFFICLSFAGFSSVLSLIELGTVALKEMGVPNRKIATVAIVVLMFGAGFASAWSIDVLNNQDYVWGFAILINGLFMQFAISYYGVFKFRRFVVNEYGYKDWKLPIVWCIMIQIVAPLEALFLLGWWIYDTIATNPTTWYTIDLTSLMVVFIEWAVLFCISFIISIILTYIVGKWKFERMSGDAVVSRHSKAYITTDDVYNCWDNTAYQMDNADNPRISDNVYEVPEPLYSIPHVQRDSEIVTVL